MFNERTAKPLMILAMAIFGTIGIMTRYIDMPAALIVLFRGAVGTLFLLAVIYLTGNRLDKKGIKGNMRCLLLSGICLGVNWIFLFEAYKTIEISTATLCNYLTPAFVIFVSPIFLGERFTFVKAAAVLAAVFGMALVSGVFENGITDETQMLGIFEGVMAAVFYTGMIIFNKKLGEVGPFDRTAVQLAVGGSVVLIYCLFSVDFGSLALDTVSVVLAVVMGIVQTGVAFTLYFGSLRYLEAGTASVYGYVEPILSLFLAAVILGEVLSPVGWIGAALVLGSTLLYELLGSRKIRRYSSKTA